MTKLTNNKFIEEAVNVDDFKTSLLRFMRSFSIYGRKPNQTYKLYHSVHKAENTWHQPNLSWAIVLPYTSC